MQSCGSWALYGLGLAGILIKAKPSGLAIFAFSLKNDKQMKTYTKAAEEFNSIDIGASKTFIVIETTLYIAPPGAGSLGVTTVNTTEIYKNHGKLIQKIVYTTN